MRILKIVLLAVAVLVMFGSVALANDIFVKDVDVSFIPVPDGTVIIRSVVEVSGQGTGKLAGIRVDGNLCVRTDDCFWYTGYTDRKGIVSFDRSYGYIPGAPAQFCIDNLSRTGDVYNRFLNSVECDTDIMQ